MADTPTEFDTAKGARLMARRKRSRVMAQGHLDALLGAYLRGKIQRGEQLPREPEALRDEILSTTPQTASDRQALARFFSLPASNANADGG